MFKLRCRLDPGGMSSMHSRRATRPRIFPRNGRALLYLSLIGWVTARLPGLHIHNKLIPRHFSLVRASIGAVRMCVELRNTYLPAPWLLKKDRWMEWIGLSGMDQWIGTKECKDGH